MTSEPRNRGDCAAEVHIQGVIRQRPIGRAASPVIGRESTCSSSASNVSGLAPNFRLPCGNPASSRTSAFAIRAVPRRTTVMAT
jgi:hypothetical protein